MIGVYKITYKKTGDIYIGSTTKSFKKRKKDHLDQLKWKKHHNYYMQNIYNKHGSGGFEFEIVEICEKCICLDRENHYMKTLNPKLNMTLDARAPMRGRTHTKEAKLKISKNHGRHNKNKPQSKEAKIKNVISNGGSPIICINTGEKFISIAEAAKKLNLSRQNISSVIHGRLKTTGKLSFKRINQGELD